MIARAVDACPELGRPRRRANSLSEAGQTDLDSGELAPCGSGLVGHRAARPLYDAGARPQGRERADQGEPPVEIRFGVPEVGRERAGLVERPPPDGDARDRPDEAPDEDPRYRGRRRGPPGAAVARNVIVGSRGREHRLKQALPASPSPS